MSHFRKIQRIAAALFLILPLAAASVRGEETGPLAPPDTGSPRATIRSFLDRSTEIHTIVESAKWSRETRERIVPKARILMRCFDLSHLPPSVAETEGFLAAVSLKEVFDRIELPAEASIPDDQQAREEELARWRVPGTEIVLIRIEQGSRAGEWVFDTETVLRAPQFFRSVRHLPYRADATSPGLYRLYVSLTGWMIPAAWVDALPAWMHAEYAEHRAWQWLSMVALMALAAGIVLATHRLGRPRGPQPEPMGLVNGLLKFVSPLFWMGFALLLDIIFSTQIRMTGYVLIGLKIFLQFQVYLAGIVLVMLGMNRLADLIIRIKRLGTTGIDGQMVRLGMRILVSLMVAWLVVVAAERLGLSVMPLLAGLGVSGLAVALAAQYTVENLIAGLVLYADQPVRVGEFCRFGDTMGTIEQIGLRSTRIRSLDRMVVTVPNAEFAKLQLVNFTRRDRILLKTLIGLRYETTPEQLRYVLARIRQLLLAHPHVSNEPARARFIGFGAYSMDIELFAFIETSDHNVFLGVQEDLLLRVIDIVEEAGAGFAFPSQTTYLARDGGLDAARARQAEGMVEDWRRSGTLPFPEFSAEERTRIGNTLEYPPPGSPAGRPWADTPPPEPEATPERRPTRVDEGHTAGAPHIHVTVATARRGG